MRIDLNADVGEAIPESHDSELLPQVTSANIACGLHAGSPDLMWSTVNLAREFNVAIGAHPGFADREGFGRRAMRLTGAELESLILYQLGALSAIALVSAGRVAHVKPHGALYNMAASDPEMAAHVARAVKTFDRNLILVGLAGSSLLTEGDRVGLRVAGEGFADRAYRPDGSLVPRSEAGAILHDPKAVIRQALDLVQGRVVALTGERVQATVDTICIHGDTPGAAALATSLRKALADAGVVVSSLSDN